MRSANNALVDSYITTLTTGGQVAAIVHDENKGDNTRITLIQTQPNGAYFASIILENGTQKKGALT